MGSGVSSLGGGGLALNGSPLGGGVIHFWPLVGGSSTVAAGITGLVAYFMAQGGENTTTMITLWILLAIGIVLLIYGLWPLIKKLLQAI